MPGQVSSSGLQAPEAFLPPQTDLADVRGARSRGNPSQHRPTRVKGAPRRSHLTELCRVALLSHGNWSVRPKYAHLERGEATAGLKLGEPWSAA